MGLNGKKVLVCGVTGTIGQGLAYALARENEVHGLARFRDMEKWKWLEERGIHIMAKDVRRDPLDDIPTDFDVVFNEILANPDWATAVRVNVEFVADLMMHFRNSGTSIVLGSTGGVYAPVAVEDAWSNEEAPLAGSGVYCGSKAHMETIVQWVSSRFGVPCVVLRYYWPECPYTHRTTISRIVQMVSEGQPVPHNPESPWYRQVTHISDIVSYSTRCHTYAATPGSVYNVAHPRALTALEIAQAASEVVGKPFQLKTDAPERMHYLGDVSRLLERLGPPTVDLREAAQRAWRALRDNIDRPEDWMFE